MKNIYKQFVESATLSSQSEFKKAVLLLTIYYALGVFVVLTIFNIIVYALFTNSISMNVIEKQEHSKIQTNIRYLEENQIEEMQDNLLNILFISDGLILFITLIAAYLSSKRTLAPLETAYKKQARFVADAAHELRTPLAVMKAGSEVILRKDRDGNEYIKFIKESLDEVERLTTLSNNLLFLVNNKKKIGVFSDISFSELCKKQIKNISAYAQTKDIEIKDQVNEDIYVSGNEDDLIRLFINLIKNAIDYNKKDGEVVVSLKKDNNKIILSIKDSGIGIKKEELSLIFERFYKADNSRTQNSSGTGLGLSIVKEIVDEHRGAIKVTSDLEKGTIFKVIFPCI
ncbi:MAG: HAMP domain-containing sensor histidine kinase [Candidatus Nomurabacteria bacterium]|nr:HAMP domain-containing sensor histidine kinase [Candidatus Nomurabacteria bacterium]